MIKLNVKKNRNNDVVTYKNKSVVKENKANKKRYNYATNELALERVLNNQKIIDEVKGLFE